MVRKERKTAMIEITESEFVRRFEKGEKGLKATIGDDGLSFYRPAVPCYCVALWQGDHDAYMEFDTYKEARKFAYDMAEGSRYNLIDIQYFDDVSSRRWSKRKNIKIDGEMNESIEWEEN